MHKYTMLLAFIFAAALLPGCGGTPDGFTPIDPDHAVFWDRQTTESAKLIRDIADDFNAGYDGLDIKIEHTGNYGEVFRKVSASIRAGRLPAMAVAYESMTSEYIPTGAVVALDPYLEDPEQGLSQEELDDFFPVVLKTNRFEQFEGKMWSFPFAKSVLMLYFNKQVLAEAGIENPPETWDQFIEQCRQIKARTGKFAYALSVDCSTIDGMIYSMGGSVVQGKETLFDSPEAVRVFEIIETLAKEELAYQITPGTYDDEVALANNEVAFTIRSSSAREGIRMLMEGDDDRWGMKRIPQADLDHPATVLFGPNITVFNTNPEQQAAAWAFVKNFTSTETAVRWSLGTGYLPIRRSAADHPDMKAFFAEWPYNRAAYDCLEIARSEPNIVGWQQVRGLVQRAETDVLNGVRSAREAAAKAKKEADEVLARQ